MTTFLFFLPFILLFVVMAVYAERKISAFVQDRIGPMEVGKYGLLQTIADLLKLLQKEDIVSRDSDHVQFKLGPIIIFTAIFTGFAVLPLTSGISGARINTGIYFLLAIISLDVMGILMTGWGSNSKFSLFGAMRSVAQIVSYEVPLGLSVLCVVMLSQSLDLQEISYQQGIFAVGSGIESQERQYLFGFINGIDVTEVGGFITWNIFRMPFMIFVFLIFFISSLAETNRAPFDLPEAESELIGGFHTEYSGFRFAILMLSEFAMMLLVCILGTVLFLGSWNSPFPNIGALRLADWTSGLPGTWGGNLWGGFWLISKALFLIFIQMWVRWTFPRLRVDQLMTLSWKYLTPAILILVMITGIWRVLLA